MQITPRQAAQRILDALAAAMPYAPHCAEFDRVADAADDLRAALKREEEALTQETDMSTLREAAQQALAALEDLSDCYDGDDDYDGECASCHTRSYLPHDADCKRNNAVNDLRAALKREEEAITLELIGRQRDDHDTPPNTEPLALRLSEGLGAWVPAHERVPAVGTECVVLVRYTLDRPPFCTVDKWDVQREDPTGMGGPTIETGEGWNDNFDCDVIAWIAIPPHPPAEWDQRLPA